jgi:AmiR/NasT family two-component response regulator
MNSTLLLDLAQPHDAAWRAALDRTGVHLGAACAGDNLVQCTMVESASLLICVASGVMPELEAALMPWHGNPPLAVLLLTPRMSPDPDVAARAVALGIHHWQALAASGDGTLPAVDVGAAIVFARARHHHESSLQRAAANAQAHLDERKWIDRAKGVLMASLGLDEAEAFRLLRGAAMSVNLRIGELSQAVVESARWADAMNRAGQLRMLSQRLVRIVAQQLLRIQSRDAAALAEQSVQRVRENLEMLVRQCAATDAQAASAHTERCWQALSAALVAPRVDAQAIGRIDALASNMLEAAEQLTETLQATVGRRALHIVNQCGRQRMRVQRIAKESLLAAMQPSPSTIQVMPQRRSASLDDFETAQRELEETPLTSPEIRRLLEQVRDEWRRLLTGLEASTTSVGRRALVQASESMLLLLDSLTAAYEHSFQVIMG